MSDNVGTYRVDMKCVEPNFMIVPEGSDERERLGLLGTFKIWIAEEDVEHVLQEHEVVSDFDIPELLEFVKQYLEEEAFRAALIEAAMRQRTAWMDMIRTIKQVERETAAEIATTD